MRINFFIPFISKSGGIIAVLEYFLKLTSKGHDVVVYYPLVPHWCLFSKRPPLLFKIAIFVKRCFLKHKIKWYFEEVPVQIVLNFSNRFIRDADISVATAWPTAYEVNRFDYRKGKKFYFVQGHETWINDIKLVEESYRIPLRLITVSPWLTEIMEKKYARTTESEIYNGVRTDKFFPPLKKLEQPVTVSMQYHELECKGAQEALKALAKIKTDLPDIRVILFGLFASPEKTFDFEYFRNPDYQKLLAIYQESHIYLFPSHGEGWGMTPLEAMACGCAVVGTNVGSIKVIGTSENVLKIRAGSVNSIYRGLKLLILDSGKRKRIAESGYKTVQRYTWERAGELMEKTFLDACRL